MASTSASPKKFPVYHSLCIPDAWSNFDSKTVIKSQEFCRRGSPKPTLFRLELDFKESTNVLGAYFVPINKAVTVFKMKAFLLDERCRIVRELVSDHQAIAPKNGRFGWADFHNIGTYCGNRPLVKWHFIFELEYNAPFKPSPASTTPDPDLHLDLGKLLTSKRHADVTFLVEGESIVAHKAVLSARCQYFERMFESDVKENISNQIEVTDIDSAVFKEMLLFLYSGQPPKLSAVKALNLLSAADKYGIESLKKVCESIVCDNLNSDIAVEALVLAKNISCLTLKEEATNYLKVNLACLID